MVVGLPGWQASCRQGDEMSSDGPHDHPKPGTQEYSSHLREEIEQYSRIYQHPKARETLMQPVPSAWVEVETRSAALIRQLTGNDLVGHVAERLRDRPGARMLSLGSGPGGVELILASQAPEAAIVCMDVNPDLLQLGRQRAKDEKLNLEFVEADLNRVELPPAEFDMAFCHAALHHVIELDRLMDQVGRTLRPGGVFITVDVVTRNGYLMWPETKEIVEAIWKTLPPKFRLNHSGYATPLLDDEIWEADTSLNSMECVRSEDILPAIDRRFVTEQFVPYFSISRRFFDSMYGPNYDLAMPLDKAIFDWIWELDLHYLATKRLRPETFFGIYRPKGEGFQKGILHRSFRSLGRRVLGPARRPIWRRSTAG
jgi:SAM-dependent methyltransferase